MSEVRRTCVSGQCWAAAALGAADQVRLRVCCMCVCVCCWTGGNRASSVCCSVWVDVGEDGGILLILLIELVRLGSWQRTKGGRRHPWTLQSWVHASVRWKRHVPVRAYTKHLFSMIHRKDLCLT